METNNLNKLASILQQSNDYRIIKRYKKPECYNKKNDNNFHNLIGVFLDIEATGLSYATDKIIELGMVKFEYSKDGRIFRLLDEFCKYQDPNMPIPESITNLTGITDATVKGQQINVDEVNSYLEGVDIIIAHNAQFDRTFFEMTFPFIGPKPWGCLMYDVDWKNEGISSYKLEYIAYKYNFFFEGHRAITDCLAGVHILAQKLLISKNLVFSQLLHNAKTLRFKLWAINSPYDRKELLKARGYKWSANPNDRYKGWSIEIIETKVVEEIDYLKSKVYGTSMDIPVEVFDAHNRFSIHYKALQNTIKYQDKIEWVKVLCMN